MSTPHCRGARRALASTVFLLVALAAASFPALATEAIPAAVSVPSLARLSAAPFGERAVAVDLANVDTPAVPVAFEVPATQTLQIHVLDLEGEVVTTLAEGLWAEGRHVLGWYHVDADGDPLEDGVYVIRLERDPASLDADAIALKTARD